MRKIISLLGKPCAGKGTRLSKFLEGKEGQYTVISFGDLLRKEVAEGTLLGMQAKSYMNAGELVPDYIIINLVLDELRKTPKDKTVILDGFPRTLEQADAALECSMGITQVAYLKISDEVAINRSANRVICQECGEAYTTNGYKPPKKEGICDKCGGKLIKRDDDKPEIMKERLEIFSRQTEPAIQRLKKSGIDYIEVEAEDTDTM